MDRRSIFAFLAAALVAAPAVDRPALAGEKRHRLAIHVDQSDIAQMNLALGNASNVFEHYKSRGEGVDIEIVTYSQGLHMLREDTSPVKPRLKSFKQGMPNVSFMACENTLEAMARNEGKEPPLVENAERVKAGVVTLIELGEKGWTIVRP